MCLSYPGRVSVIDEAGAIVVTDGRARRASTLYLPDIAVGDWVIVATGTIVERLDPAEAAVIERLLSAAVEPEEIKGAIDVRHA